MAKAGRRAAFFLAALLAGGPFGLPQAREAAPPPPPGSAGPPASVGAPPAPLIASSSADPEIVARAAAGGTAEIADRNNPPRGARDPSSFFHPAPESREQLDRGYTASGLRLAVQASVGGQGDRAARARLDLGDAPLARPGRPVQLRTDGQQPLVTLLYRRSAGPDHSSGWEGAAGVGGVGRASASRSPDFLEVQDGAGGLEHSPHVFSTLRGTALTLAQPSWPSLTLALTRTNREGNVGPLDSITPLRRPLMDQAANAFSGQLGYTWRLLTLDVGLVRIQKFSTLQPSRKTEALAYNAGLVFGLFDDRLTLSTGLSWTDAQTLFTDHQATPSIVASTLTRTILGTFAASGILVPGELTFDGQFSLASTRTKDGNDAGATSPLLSGSGRRTVTADAVGRLTWNFEKYIGNRGGQALSLRLEWNRAADVVSPVTNRSDFGVFLSLDVPAPFLF